MIGHDGRILRYGEQSTAEWYDDTQFQFLVYDDLIPWRGLNGGTAVQTATEAFGAPARSYTVGRYHVLVWSHPITVSGGVVGQR